MGYRPLARRSSDPESSGRNHTWGEVLVSVIRDLKIPCQVDGKSEEEFESVICEHVTEQEWKSRDERERREI